MLKVIAAPGPVSYPMIASTMKNKDIMIDFGKEGSADVILDSTVSLVRRGIRTDYITIKGLMVVSPDVGRKIGVWRKGSAADVLTRALLEKKGLKGEVVYADDMPKLMEMLNRKEVDSIVVASPFAKGKTFEELLGIPGSCGASVNGDHEAFISAYSEGIELMKQDPQGVAEYIAKKLPIQANPQMIINLPKTTVLGVERIADNSHFENLIRKHL
ncbi:hypothetical protein L3N51_01297 [Metallosphaera sp. J1]|uniref:DUF3834 domain-containing protein n=1 Tax=Metallosphaera javensis (ex Hofmann et al. 2022) TaxID=99938 RepID=UPI001EDD4C6A|nr:DUF3834 domain-containing protein [Metallosphaera javensis (ex Hofmann et al. 2022)]MCG3109007.1 hypothetical protein [Metallosphaera javensis (ex Hofmann et al. 2022)]